MTPRYPEIVMQRGTVGEDPREALIAVRRALRDLGVANTVLTEFILDFKRSLETACTSVLERWVTLK